VIPLADGHAQEPEVGGGAVTIHQLARDIVRLCGSRSALKHIVWNFADVELRVPDISKARKLLGFEPLVDLDEGLTRTIAWYRQQPVQATVNATQQTGADAL